MKRLTGLSLMATLVATSLAAQTSHDAPRTMFGFSVGVLPGGLLWKVPDQPINGITSPPAKDGTTPAPYGRDIWDLNREQVTRRPIISIHGVRFVGPHLGYAVEFTYLALQTRDACHVKEHGHDQFPGDPALQAVCDAIPHTAQGSSGSIALQAGLIYRPMVQTRIQPYLEAMAGFATSSNSSATLVSRFGDDQMDIYTDPAWSNVHPVWTFGGGLATSLVPGLQVRVEGRDSWVAQSVVTGPSAGQGTPTPVATRYRGFFGVLVGFDLVLSRQRGKRY